MPLLWKFETRLSDAGPCCTFEELPCTFPAAAAALSVEAAAVQKSAEICRASGLSASSVVLGVLSSGVLPQYEWLPELCVLSIPILPRLSLRRVGGRLLCGRTW